MFKHAVKPFLAAGGLAFAFAISYAQAPEAPVSLRLMVPGNARVKLDGTATRATGPVRQFLSPPVPVGNRYVYTVTVVADGKTVTRDVSVTPGLENTADFRSDFSAGQRVAAYPANITPAGTSTADDKQEITSKATRQTPATSVNFRKQLGLPFPSLATLGSRIDTARRAPDPVALAHTASELSVAEKVSGKQASLTSTTVIKEAAELAGLRRQATELQAVSQVAQQIAAEDRLIANIRQQTAIAEQTAKMYTQAYEQGQAPTPGVLRKVLVNNNTPQYLTLYVDGTYRGEMAPWARQTLVIAHPWNPTVLTANGNEDIDKWGPIQLWGQFDVYKWNINTDS
jgi:uncharacterized protein (TIGR03000 family)